VKLQSLIFMIVIYIINMGGFIAAMVSALKDQSPKD